MEFQLIEPITNSKLMFDNSGSLSVEDERKQDKNVFIKKTNIFLPSIAVEGNIASGKTTILKQIEQELEIPVFYEKIHLWKFLENFYKNPQQYSMIFQLEVLFSFSKAHSCRVPHLSERSSASSFLVFATNLRKKNLLTAKEYKILESIWEQYNQNPTLILYLEVSPETCFNRLKKRNRRGEEQIPLSYLKELDVQYKIYLEKMSLVSEIVILPEADQEETVNLALFHTEKHMTDY